MMPGAAADDAGKDVGGLSDDTKAVNGEGGDQAGPLPRLRKSNKSFKYADPHHATDGVARVSLYRILLDVEEFHGFNRLLFFILYFCSAVLLLYTQWGGPFSNAPAFKTSMAEGLKSILCSPDGVGAGNVAGQQPISMEQISDIAFAVDYLTGYLNCSIIDTEYLNLTSDSTLWAGQFGRISYAHLLADLETACVESNQNKMLRKDGRKCYRDQPGMSLSSLWAPTNPRQRKLGFNKVAVLKTPETTRTQLMSTLSNITYGGPDPDQPIYNDRAYLGKYALGLKLQILAFDRLGSDAAYFSFEVRYASGHYKTVRQIASSTIAPAFTREHYIWFGLFLLGNVIFTIREVSVARLSYLQRGRMKPYLSCWWNWITLCSQAANWAWTILYVMVLCNWNTISKQRGGKGPIRWEVFPETNSDFAELERAADFFTGFLYGGLLVLLFLGLRICRFMRIHLGMKALYLVFVDVARHIIDFAVFAIYILVVLGVLVFAFFQISGGNPLFVEFNYGLSAMARLAFGYLDYSDFYNQATGLNVDWQWTRSALFWLSVVCLGVFFTNMLIAIFNDAYGRAMSRAIKVEHTFLGLIFMRIGYMLFYIFWLLPRHIMLGRIKGGDHYRAYPLLKNRRSALSVFMGRRLTTYMQILGSKDPSPKTRGETNMELCEGSSWLSKWARWSLSGCFEMNALLSYYMDYADLKIHSNKAVDVHWRKLKEFDEDLPMRSEPSGSDKISRLASSRAHRNAVEDMRAWVTREELREVMAEVLATAERLKQYNGMSLWWVVCMNPMYWIKASNTDLLVDAMLDVYEGVPRPMVDANDDGVDDNDQELTAQEMQRVIRQELGSLQLQAPGSLRSPPLTPPTRSGSGSLGPGVSAGSVSASAASVEELQLKVDSMSRQLQAVLELLEKQQQKQ